MLLFTDKVMRVLPLRVMPPLPTLRAVPDPVTIKAALVPTPLPPMVSPPVPSALEAPTEMVPPLVMIVPPV